MKHYAMKAHEAVDVQIHIFLTSALVGRDWSASRSGNFTPGERDPGTHRRGDWVDLRAGLDDLEKRIFFNKGTSNSDPSVVQSVSSRYTDYAIPAPPLCPEYWGKSLKQSGTLMSPPGFEVDTSRLWIQNVTLLEHSPSKHSWWFCATISMSKFGPIQRLKFFSSTVLVEHFPSSVYLRSCLTHSLIELSPSWEAANCAVP
jgi:hypothetical protein